MTGPARKYSQSEWAEKVFGTERKAVSPHPPTSARWQEQAEYIDQADGWRTVEQ